MRIALREDMTPGRSLAERLAYLERAGIEGIELSAGSLDLPDDELRATMFASPVRAANIAGGMKLLDPDPAVRERSFEITRRRLAIAAELGAAGVLEVPQFGRGPALPDLSPFQSGRDLESGLFATQLARLAPLALAAGVPLFLEPLNRYEAYLVNRVEQGAQFARAAGPGIATMVDFFHANIEEVDVANSIRVAGEEVVYVHVADSNRQQPGNGHFDFGPGFTALKEIGYDGWVGIECRIVGPFDESLRAAVEHVRRLWDAA
jgi:sugar phosphate isomerase/epimerase